MPESALSRLWNLVKPPPAGPLVPLTPEVIAQRKRQRKLVIITTAAVAVVASGAWLFVYIQSAPERADKEFQDGMNMMRPNQYPEAIRHFTRALEIFPQLPNARLQRGNAHRFLDEPDAALADFQAAADLDPSLADAHTGSAMIYVQRNDAAHAISELNKSLSIHPNIEAFYQRGLILEARGEHEKAIADFDLAIAQSRDAPYMYRARATAKEHLGDQAGAHADREFADRLER